MAWMTTILLGTGVAGVMPPVLALKGRWVTRLVPVTAGVTVTLKGTIRGEPSSWVAKVGSVETRIWRLPVRGPATSRACPDRVVA